MSGGGIDEVIRVAFSLIESVPNLMGQENIENEVVWYSGVYMDVQGSLNGRWFETIRWRRFI